MAWFIAATLAAFFIKGLCGFANTLIFQSILSFSVNNADISPVELVLGFPGNAILTWQNRKSLNPRIFLPLTALMLAGNIPGALMLKSIDGRIIKVIFGVVIICIALNMLLEQSKEPHAPKKWMTRSSASPRVSSAAYSASVRCWLLTSAESRIQEADLRQISVLVFLTENVFRLLLYAMLGMITPAVLKSALLLMPAMLASLFAGIAVSRQNQRPCHQKAGAVSPYILRRGFDFARISGNPVFMRPAPTALSQIGLGLCCAARQPLFPHAQKRRAQKQRDTCSGCINTHVNRAGSAPVGKALMEFVARRICRAHQQSGQRGAFHAADAQGMAVKPKQYGVLRHVRGFANQKLKRIHRNRARRLLSETEGKNTQNDFRHRSALLAGNIPRMADMPKITPIHRIHNAHEITFFIKTPLQK